MNDISLILQKHLSQANVRLEGEQLSAVLFAMHEYADRMISKHHANERKEFTNEAIKLFPSLLMGEFTLWLRYQSFKRAKRMAQLRADTENYKIYVILKSKISYVLLSSAEIDYNKRVRILGKNLNDIELTKKAAFVAIKQR